MVDRSRLRQFMTESFNEDELADLVFDYFPTVRSHLSEGMSLGQKIRVLIDYADRHGRTDHLIVVLEKLRPDAYCEFFQTDLALPPEPETARRDPKQVFISYAGADADFAARLAADLRANDIPVWLAPDSILPGEKWVAAIERGLSESGIFLLVLSPEAVDSKWVSQETQVAIMLENEGKMRVYPLRVRPAEIPLLLSTRQYVAFDKSYDRGLLALLAVLGKKGHTPAPPPAEAAPAAPPRPAITETLLVTTDLPVLIIDWPDGPNEEITLGKIVTTLGRAPDNDIRINLPIVSSHHLRLETEDDGLTVRVRVTDLGSRNGTFLSGRRLAPNTPQLLEPGDVLHLGDRIGRSISVILRPDVAGGPVTDDERPPEAVIAAGLVATDEEASDVLPQLEETPPMAAVPVLEGSVPVAAAPVSGGATGGGWRAIPVWAYAAAGVAALLLLAFLLLRGRGGERPAGADVATPGVTQVAVVVAEPTADDRPPTTEPAADDGPLAAGATAEPSIAPTDVPASEPTAAPTAEPTAADTAEPTAEPTAAATEAPAAEPTAEVIDLPALPANFEISRASPLSFEALGEWLRDNAASRSAGTLTVSDAQARTGSYSLALAYDFPGAGDDYVAFNAGRPYRIANDRERRFFKVWALGDGARMNLSAVVVDSEGELWKVFLGEINGTEWQQLQGYIGDTVWPSRLLSSGLSGEVDFPVRLLGFHLDDVDATFAGAGTVYLDDVTVE